MSKRKFTLSTAKFSATIADKNINTFNLKFTPSGGSLVNGQGKCLVYMRKTILWCKTAYPFIYSDRI